MDHMSICMYCIFAYEDRACLAGLVSEVLPFQASLLHDDEQAQLDSWGNEGAPT